MRLTSSIQKLHERAPKLGKAVSLATATGVILGNSLGASIPMWLMGATKMITGSSIADETVIKIANHWIKSNNAVINHILPKKRLAY